MRSCLTLAVRTRGDRPSARARWSREQLRQELAQLGRALQRLAQRSEVALVDDQGHALETAGVVVCAEADLVRTLCLAFREFQQLDGGSMIGRLDLCFFFDDTV